MIDQPPASLRWDIFCRVIDNFGDAGVCWRLAADLASRGEQVCLYIDQPELLTGLISNAPVAELVSVHGWPEDDQSFTTSDIADVVIEAFACDPPAAYIHAMSQANRYVAWINLEYLSAEDWVASCHRSPSPHPSYALTKHFYFPGFTPETGGLLREPTLMPQLEQLASARTHEALQELKLFLFSYQQPAIASWLDVLEMNSTISLSVAPCPAWPQIAQWTAEHLNINALKIRPLPFVPQHEFDELLADFDVLFIRGEDSFVRAQWAGKPLVWHIYPQDDDVHLVKLRAFYDQYLTQGALTETQRYVYWRFVLAWNGGPLSETLESLEELWPEFVAIYPALLANARAWRQALLKQADLVTQLKDFVSHLVKC